eukprot:TRINITY_DN9589_c0_g3_i1.p1 TRINITY_DN9589_c0_g3~~TRINITY_DN9589_c0_g3_i1.p1  ORF type:complete len:480 (+),score=152.71 TRINITY_DN9589_c0_g3_i1:2-1441(+)
MALKVSKATKKGGYSIGEDIQQQIKQYNWADVQVYRALNHTLFERMRRAIGFDEEVAWLKSEKMRYYELCKQFLTWGDDKHRKALLEGDPDEDEEMCHLLMLDSPGFVKLLKEKWGKKDPECHTQGQMRNALVHVPTGAHADSTFANVLLRKAFRAGLSPAFPRDGKSFGYPEAKSRQAIMNSLQANSYNPTIFAGFNIHFDPTVLRSLATDVILHPMIEHPISHFKRVWVSLGVSKLLSAKFPDRASVTMEDFVLHQADQSEYLSALSATVLDALINPLNRRFEKFGDKPVQRARILMGKTDKVLIAEHLDESLLFMRRFVCWKIEDMLYLKHEQSSTPNMQKLNEVDAAIAKLNRQDMTLYKELNASLWRGIGREISFHDELLNFKATRKQLLADCKRFMTDNATVSDVVAVVSNPKTSSNERQCRLMTLKPNHFAKVFASRPRMMSKDERQAKIDALQNRAQARVDALAADDGTRR